MKQIIPRIALEGRLMDEHEMAVIRWCRDCDGSQRGTHHPSCATCQDDRIVVEVVRDDRGP